MLLGIIDCQISNIASLRNAYAALDISTQVLQNPEDIVGCSHLVLPGVGSFARGMENIKRRGMNEAIIQQVKTGTPLLGICLGMQLLAEFGTEFDLTEGLGLVPGTVDIMSSQDAGFRLPHVGWNEVITKKPCPLLTGISSQTFYFVHSYAYVDPVGDDVVGITDYCNDVVAVVARENVYGTQFHPEKSQKSGLTLLKNFVTIC